MEQISKTIYDILVAGKGINLPGVGSLHIEREPAKIVKGRQINPPINKVAFSTKNSPSFGSVVDRLGTDRKEAEKTYEKWLEDAARPENTMLEINGVGVLKDGTFYPSAALHDALNPATQNTIYVKKRMGFWKKYFLILGSVILIGLLVYLFICLDRKGKLAFLHRDNTESVERIRTADEKGESTIAVTVAEGAHSDAAKTEDVIQQGLEGYAGSVTAGVPVHHVVAGVFAYPENADKLIAQDELGLGKSAYKKIIMNDGRTMVSAFSSTNRKEAQRKLNEWSWIVYDLWLHTENPQK